MCLVVEYAKHSLSCDTQVTRRESSGAQIGERPNAVALPCRVGYYRLTGHLYPFRESTSTVDSDGQPHPHILNHYKPGTSLEHASQPIYFDREVRMLVLDGIERIEVSLRMQVGYILRQVSPFTHQHKSTFVSAFTDEHIDLRTDTLTSRHAQWLQRVDARRTDSDEAFVAHFLTKYGDQMPNWVLTEVLEMDRPGRLHAGLNNSPATEIAQAYGAPTKKLMTSWITSLNYVRNVSAHHARLFNQKLATVPGRPKPGLVPALHLMWDGTSAKAVFGLYNALAIMA